MDSTKQKSSIISVITPHPTTFVEQREHDDAVRLKVLREAVILGIEDIEAGRYTAMDSKADLRTHISTLTSQALQDHK